MAKKFFNTTCIHCCRYFDELTSDHVFPKSWYPKSTPEDIEKWQAPSCSDCNRKIGAIENELLIKFGLCLDPYKQGALGVPEKALNSLDSKRGRTEKDSKIRGNKRSKILDELICPEDIPPESVIPNVSDSAFLYTDGVPIDPDHLEKVIKKIIKGITWITTGDYLCNDYEIEIFLFQDPLNNSFSSVIKKANDSYSIGDGIHISRVIAADAPPCGAYEIVLWNQIISHATVTLSTNQTTK